MRLAASTAAALLAVSSPAAMADAPSPWVSETAISALDLCTPAQLDPVAAARAAEAGGWPTFKSGKISGAPGLMSARRESAVDKKSPRVGLAFQSVTGGGTKIFSCYVRTTEPVIDALQAALKSRYGGDGEGGWWLKETPEGRQPLTLGEMVDGVDSFRPLLAKLPAGSRIIFATVKGDDKASLVVIATYLKAD